MIDIVSTRVGSDSKLPCIEGWKISKEFSIEKTKIGDICKGSNIKISDCELGLFGKKKNTSDLYSEMEIKLFLGLIQFSEDISWKEAE